MCNTRLVTERYPDGHKEKSYRYELCSEARMGRPCRETSSSSKTRTTAGSYTYTDPYLPPTPSYTPVSSTPVYRSGDESDRSYHSSPNPPRHRRSHVYPQDDRFLHVSSRSYRNPPRDIPHRASERVVIVDSPPTSRTPPQVHHFPHSAPSSPNFGNATPHIVEASPRSRESRRHQHVIVDERPRPRVKIVEPSPERQPSRKQTYADYIEVPRASKHPTTSTAATAGSTFDEAVQRREQRREQRILEKAEKQRAEIAAQNAEINSRPSVPVSRPLKRSTTAYHRPSVAFDPATEVMTESMSHMDLNREQRRDERARRQAEDEALDRRLRERLMPKRRATVGPGTRRHPVLYDDGVYRWE